ncbi:MAG: M1 family metallopeptidase [Minicystis sp.]
MLATIASGCFLGGDPAKVPDTAQTAPVPAPVPPPLPSGRLPDTARPVRYTVALAVDPANDRFSGNVTIALDVPQPTRAVVLHARDLGIKEAEVVVAGKHLAAETSVRMAAGGREAPDELVVTVAEPIPAGAAELRIAYSAPFGGKLSGLFHVKEDDVSYAFTQSQPIDARRVIPCFDEPGFKVPFELEVTTSKGNLVLANTPEIAREDAEEGRRVKYKFAPTPPLPTYLFALAVGPFDMREATKAAVPLRLVAPTGKAALGGLALEAATAHLDLLAAYFDRPFPYPKLDLVAVPELGFGAMENAGLISFREDLVLLDPRSASAEARRAMASSVVHEIAHHWFGNLVTMKWWDDLWLNEGFANWIESKILDTWRPATGARMDALRGKLAVMELDGLDSARAVRQKVAGSGDAEDAFDDVTYDKSAAVLGMLESWLGPDTFRDGVRGYVKTHAFASATAADLWGALGKAANRDVAKVAATFLDQPGVPLVRAELSCKSGEAPRVTLAQLPYRARSGAAPDRAWTIPICVAYEGAGEPACGVIESAGTEITLPASGHCPKWIYPNAEERGYFHFALPPAGMRALTRAARSLSPAERIGLLAGTWALVQSGDVPADALLDLLETLRGEHDRRVVDQMIAALAHVDRALVDDASRPAFRAFVTKTLGPTARELGFDPKKGEPDDRRLLRVSVLAALADLADDPWVLAEAEKRAVAWIGDPRKVSADVAAIALRAGSRRSGEKRFEDLLAGAKRARSPEERLAAVSAIGGFADPALLRRGLDRMFAEPLKIQDGFHVFQAAMARPAARPIVLAWVKQRFGELRGKMPDFALSRLASAVETICEAHTLEDAAAFFNEALKGTEGGERAIVHALEKSELCIDVRAREAARVGKRLGHR